MYSFIGAIFGLVLAVILALFLAVAFSGGKFVEYIAGFLGLRSKNDVLTFLGIGMGGVLLALQALIAYRRAKAMETAAQAQAEGAQAQAEAAQAHAMANEHTEQGQRQERLKDAIEHLGHSSDLVRLDGSYELFPLAEDTPAVRKTVSDILCAHIRRTTSEEDYRDKYWLAPSEETQSLLTLLCVQEHSVFQNFQVNLQGSWLNGVNLANARLQKIILDQSHLKGANLSWAQMQNAQLRGTHLQSARLSFAKLHNADLANAYLQGSSAYFAHFCGVSLDGAQLQGADLFSAQLQRANLSRA